MLLFYALGNALTTQLYITAECVAYVLPMKTIPLRLIKYPFGQEEA